MSENANYQPRHAAILDLSIDRGVHELKAKLLFPGDDLGPKHRAGVALGWAS